MKDLWKSSGWTVEIQWDREATLRRHGHKYHLKNIHRYIWHRWCKSCLNCHFLRLEVYLSNQEYSNLAAACFEPIFFSMLLFLDFSLKDTLNKTITAISQNLLKQHIFFFRMAHSSFSLQCESREILSSAWKDIRYIKWVRWQWTKPWWCISLQKVNRRKNTGLFQIESRFCRELETTLCKSPAIGVHLFFFFKMGINH